MTGIDEEDPECEHPECHATPTEDVGGRVDTSLIIYWVCSDHIEWAKARVERGLEPGM